MQAPPSRCGSAASGQFHGYLIARESEEATDARLLTAYGTLYRALGRLEQMGLMTSTWEDPQIPADENRPRRRLYAITPDGRRRGQRGSATAAARRWPAPGDLMSPPSAAGVARWWTRVYTAGLPSICARRAARKWNPISGSRWPTAPPPATSSPGSRWASPMTSRGA